MLMVQENLTVREVFDRQASSMTKTVTPDNLVCWTLSPSQFLTRVCYAGFRAMDEIEVACVIKVLTRPELYDQIRFDELEMLLEGFGVPSAESKTLLPLQIEEPYTRTSPIPCAFRT